MKLIDSIIIRIFDFLLASILLILLSPFMILALLMSSLFIGFPPIYTSLRKGKNGLLFRHIKIKSLLPGKEVGRIFLEQHRLNWCGKLLRGCHLDELTELLHIISGKMSFVGPRPLPPKLLKGLNSKTRETVPPGWTCTAQLLLLKRGKLNKHAQIRLDNLYARKRSFFYNIKILAATPRYFLSRSELDLKSDSTPDRLKFKNQNLNS